MGSREVVSLSSSEKFLGCNARVALIDDPLRQCFEARSATERVVLEEYGEEIGDFVVVIDEGAVLVGGSDVTLCVRSG